MKSTNNKRDTRIICTVGPACASEKMLAKMASRGMDVVRLNFSHGTHPEHQNMIDMVRKVNREHGFQIKILQDLEGHRIRIGKMKKEVLLEKNKDVCFVKQENLVDYPKDIPLDILENIDVIYEGLFVLIDDGHFRLKVLGVSKDRKRLKCKVISGGVLKQRKGVVIPKLKLSGNIMTKKDKNDLQFGLDNQVDYVAQSFVRNKKDIMRVVDIVRQREYPCKVIAKIETHEGIKNLANIIDACDCIMVARGDLGVTMPIYKLPIIQKYIIARCNRKKKFVVTATQMLESMIYNGIPTRAEVSDVANAILDGTDFVMLSGETAVGKYPSRSVQMMRQIIDYTEDFERVKI